MLKSMLLLAIILLSCSFKDVSAKQQKIIEIDHKDVIKIETSANNGDPEAQQTLGQMYVYGEGVPQDYVKARSYWEASLKKQDSAEIKTLLGALYLAGFGGTIDKKHAKFLFQTACQQKNQEACDTFKKMKKMRE